MKNKGIFATVILSLSAFAAWLMGKNDHDASSIGIIGGADGPTAIFVAGKLPKHYIIAGVFLAAAIISGIVLLVAKLIKGLRRR